MTRVLFFSPGFPAEMPMFARGLAEVGAQVIGLGDTPVPALPDIARQSLVDYIRVRNLFGHRRGDRVGEGIPPAESRIDQVECVWEPGMILAAEIREALGLPGMTVDQTTPFRDKEAMKKVLDDAGIRTPRHRSATNDDEVRPKRSPRSAYPVCIKPIAGAGSADTYRVDDEQELERVILLTRHVRELSVEEFIEGEEFTFDTICSGGNVHYYNVSWYRPRPFDRPHGRVDQPANPEPAQRRRAAHPGRHRHGFQGLEGFGLRGRLHPHGMVPKRRR